MVAVALLNEIGIQQIAILITLLLSGIIIDIVIGICSAFFVTESVTINIEITFAIHVGIFRQELATDQKTFHVHKSPETIVPIDEIS